MICVGGEGFFVDGFGRQSNSWCHALQRRALGRVA